MIGLALGITRSHIKSQIEITRNQFKNSIDKLHDHMNYNDFDLDSVDIAMPAYKPPPGYPNPMDAGKGGMQGQRNRPA